MRGNGVAKKIALRKFPLMQRVKLFGVTVAVTLVISTIFSSQAQIVNGSFEQNGPGWSNNSGYGWNATAGIYYAGLPDNGRAIGTDGVRAASLGTFNVANDTLSQTVTLAPNTTYQVLFDWTANANGDFTKTGNLQLTVKDGAAGTLATQSYSSTVLVGFLLNGATGFVAESLTFTTAAANLATTITFADVTPGGGIAVDDVIDNVRLAVVPEPASTALACAGFLLVASLRWRSVYK